MIIRRYVGDRTIASANIINHDTERIPLLYDYLGYLRIFVGQVAIPLSRSCDYKICK